MQPMHKWKLWSERNSRLAALAMDRLQERLANPPLRPTPMRSTQPRRLMAETTPAAQMGARLALKRLARTMKAARQRKVTAPR